MTPAAVGTFLVGTCCGFLAGFATGLAAGLGLAAAVPPPRPLLNVPAYVPDYLTSER